MANFQMTITDAGLALLADSMTGEDRGLHFTKMVMGSAAYSGSLPAVTAVIAPQYTLSLDQMSRSGGQVTFKSVLAFREVEEGFTWRELGLYAEDPAGGSDILYAYGNAGESGDYIPGSDEATLNERVIQLTVAVASSPDVTAEISGSGIFVEYSELQAAVGGLGVVTLSHEKEGTIHKLTGLNGAEGLLLGRFKATGDYAEGEVFLLDGTPYTARQENGDTLSDGQFVSGAGVAVVVDTEGKRINFKGGGGVGAADLALATATEATVFSGKTFYAGESKELRTGTALSQAVSVTANNIPPGVTAYNQAGQVITGNGSGVLKYSEHAHQFNQNSTSITFTCGFNVKMAIAYMSSLGASNRGVTGGVILPGGTSGQFRINDGNTNSGCTGSFSFSGNKLTASLEVPSYISSGRMYVDFVAIGM